MIAHAGGTDESLAIVMLFAAIWTGWIGWTRLHDNGFPRVPIAGAYGLLAIAAVLVVTSAFVPRALQLDPDHRLLLTAAVKQN